MKKIVIIGGGISGLAAGWYHLQKGHDITIVEKSERAGGWIRTSSKNSFLFEQGPRGFRPTGKGKRTLALVKELGLENALIAADKKAQKRYVVIKQKLCAFSIPLLLRHGLIGAVIRDLRQPACEKDDETIADFCTRRFNRKITQTFVDPFVKGVLGGDVEQLSMRSCFPTIWEADKQGSVIRYSKKEKQKPPASLFSFRTGMETLTKTLATKLEKHLLLNNQVIGIKKNQVILENQLLEADHIIAALPAYALANILKIADPFTYSTLTTISLGWNQALLPKRGYGFLVPSKENEPFLGMTWDSEIFPQQNQKTQTRVCVMIQGTGALKTAKYAVQKYLGIENEPDAHLISEAPNALTQYLIGHHQRMHFFQKQCPVELIGNCYTGVGINDCVEAAWKSASL